MEDMTIIWKDYSKLRYSGSFYILTLCYLLEAEAELEI